MSDPARSFQHYEVLRREDGAAWELGRGAMGVTYKAFDVNLCCEVALKVVSSALVEQPESRDRFVREARAAAALRHRNVASVYHLGNDGEHFFYAMEFINGETLDALVRRTGPLSVPDTLRVVLQVARALAAAARQSLVHRDIKPANLMVTHEDADEETVVKVIDFGLARAAASAENAPPLTIGGFVGTPQFASPEQLEERPLDVRSDLYSLGVTAWFLLTGRVPFAGSLAQVCQGQLTQPPPWEQLPADLPACVRELLRRTLEKDAAQRPQTAVELRAEVETCLDQVQGTRRKRDLHLPALTADAAVPGDVDFKRVGRSPQPGMLLNGKYRLLREVGGNRGAVGVFQARDEANAETLVAVKFLRERVSSDSAMGSRWEEQARLAQAAPHPNLVVILALERSLSPDTVFLVEEWLPGFTLRDLVAARGGALPVAETLRLLEHAVAAADHAERSRLGHLDLDPTQWQPCFSLGPKTQQDPRARTLLSQSVTQWPEWTLKTHAFQFDEDPLALDTWAGGDTLLPAAHQRAATLPYKAAAQSGQYVPALARLAYHLLGGTAATDPPAGRYAMLPALNEEANLLLKRTLTGETPFAHGWVWQKAFAKAIGGEPARGKLASTVTRPSSPATQATAVKTSARVSTGATRRAASRPVDPAAGSAWDRLTLVTGKRSHPVRWVAGIIGLGVVFVLGFVGVLAWLLQQSPGRAAGAPNAKMHRTENAVITGLRYPSRPATPAPLLASLPTVRPSVPPTPASSTASVESVPLSAPVAVAREDDVPPTSASIETTPIPAVLPPRERSAMIRVDSVPEGAQIRLGDEVLGVTPCRIKLRSGVHQLIARYENWPEIRQTVHLDGTEAHLAVEIRMMRPDLIPTPAVPSPASSEIHVRRIPAPAMHRAFPAESPSSNPSQPEVRPAQRILTPFRIDETASASPSSTPTPAITQPFTVDDGDAN